MDSQLKVHRADFRAELGAGITEFDREIITAMLAVDQVGRDELTQSLATLPNQLYAGLHPESQNQAKSERLGRNHGSLLRLVLDTDPNADNCPAALPWELLARVRKIGDPDIPIVRQVSRRGPGPSSERGSSLPVARRALIVIGDYSQLGDQAHDAACNHAQAIAQALRGFAEVVVLTAMSTSASGLEAREVVDVTTIIAELEQGYDLVHFIGHSRFNPLEPGVKLTPETAPKANELTVIVQGSRMKSTLDGNEIATALAHGRTRLVVMDCCYAHRHFAGPILESVEHFIGMNAVTPVEFGQLWGPKFYEQLAKGWSVSEALQDARREVRNGNQYPLLDFLPCHWRATEDDHPFGNSQELRLCGYVEDLRQQQTRRKNPILGKPEAEIHHVELRFGGRKTPDDRVVKKTKTAYELISPRARWLLLGDPGTGKTATLRHLARELSATRSRMPFRQIVPVLVSLPDLSEAEAHSTVNAILDPVVGDDGLVKDLEAPPEGCLLVFLIDGLDEASAKGQEVIRTLHDEYPEHAILVASRAEDRNLLDDQLGFKATRIQPLDSEQQLGLLCSALKAIRGTAPAPDDAPTPEARARDLLRSIKGNSEELATLARLPLFLALFALLDDQLSPSTTRRQLLLDSVDTLLHQRHRRPAGDPGWADGESALPLLEALALDLTALGKRSATADWLSYFFPFGGIRDGDGAQDLVDLREHLITQSKCDIVRNYAAFGHVGKFLEELKGRGLLDQEKQSTGIWKFTHKSFQEVLASNALNRMPDGMDHLFDLLSKQLGSDRFEKRPGPDREEYDRMIATWAEPLAFWVASAPEGRAQHNRVWKLVRVNGDLALRAAIYANIRNVELLQQLLAKGSKSNRSMIEQLDRLSTDNLCKTRTVIAQLKEQLTPEGLFDTDDALASLVQRDESDEEGHLSEAAEEAQAARDWMWSRYKIDPGPWLHVPGRPHLQLWREIGAPSTADLPGPFWIMSVPVTRAMFALFDTDVAAQNRLVEFPALVRWRTAHCFARWLDHNREPLFECLRTNGVSPRLTFEAWQIRLPTAQEWRFAASDGKYTSYVDGIDVEGLGPNPLEDFAVFTTDRTAKAPMQPARVASKRAGRNGLFDVHGNVLEWVSDSLERAGDLYRQAMGGSCRSLLHQCALDRTVEIPDEANDELDLQSKYLTGVRLVIAPRRQQ
ncbi:MAG: SUMF1/EgtB/PvdO family nonheme iron enzyme [bacterium]|nr:SUMF1/EgtB/PvdO family nonheme iron enzyme [bacterium]